MSEKSEAHLLEDFGDLIKLYSGGSVVRGDDSSLFSLLPEPNNYKHVEYKDVVLDAEIGLWVRLYLPPEMTSKVLVIIYYHDGGFILFSLATPIIHHKCQIWVATLGAIIVSVNYRLPCVYADSITALHWLQQQAVAAKSADPWLHSHANFSRVFIAGKSVGGNIAHHVGMWAKKEKVEMEISIKGLIFRYPFFGCEERMALKNENSPEFSLEMSDTMWRLALPVGSNRDDPFSNLVIEEVIASALDLLTILFVFVGHDILRDQ